jgi:cellulose synthase/poly-beta-1,6-N-acetylglucosamine synthase-like glycosyltransferase
MSAWSTVLTVAACCVALLSLPGSIELLLLTLGGLLPARRARACLPGPLPSLAVVVPAHDEEQGIGVCIDSLRVAGAFEEGVRVVVIADNCSDGTATEAVSHGAHVLVRFNEEERGKGHALNHAFAALMREGWDAFLIVDADTTISPGLITRTREAFAHGAAATQCGYLVRNAGGSVRTRLMNLALMAFNVLRPRGRWRWGLSCGILGNGFGVSRSLLEGVPYDATSVVEDLEYHLRLVREGERVEFLPDVFVYAVMPVSGSGVKTQRARWEGGRLRMIREHAPSLLREVLAGRFRMLEPLLELLLLPLAMHVLLLLMAVAFPFAPVRLYGLAGLALVLLHVLAGVLVAGGGWSDVAALAAAPFYVAWKVLMIPVLIRTSRSSSAWVRTEREPDQKRGQKKP